MKIDMTLWLNKFTLGNIPHWQCPTCQLGWVGLKPKHFNLSESSASIKENSEWLPTIVPWSKGVFSCILICNNKKCQESVALTGTYEVEEVWPVDEISGEPQRSFDEVYTPLTSVPALHLFTLSEYIPKAVALAIAESFKTFWLDPSSCSNKIRTAIEVILTEKKIPRFELKKNKGRNRLILHKRIQMFGAKYVKYKDEALKLEAIKWIGNEGSHSDNKITKEDLIDAYDILNHLVHKLYETETQRVERISKKIVAQKGPIRRTGVKSKKT